MYYFSENNKTLQFDSARDFVLTYAEYFRNQIKINSREDVCDLVSRIKNSFTLSKESDNCAKEDRLAVMLSEKQGTAEDLADFMLLIFYGNPDIKVNKFSMILANRGVPAEVIGSSINQIKHYGLCFKIIEEDIAGEAYIDLSIAMQKLSNVDAFSNEKLREIYKDDFYFRIINKIYDISANNIYDYYDKIIATTDLAKPRGCI